MAPLVVVETGGAFSHEETDMKMIARICFPEDDAELGVVALRKGGYSVLTKVFDDEPEYLFVEAYADAASDELMLDEIGEIVNCFHGSVADAGRVPTGHVPFEYETEVWKPYGAR
jgi:hypothetical protein